MNDGPLLRAGSRLALKNRERTGGGAMGDSLSGLAVVHGQVPIGNRDPCAVLLREWLAQHQLHCNAETIPVLDWSLHGVPFCEAGHSGDRFFALSDTGRTWRSFFLAPKTPMGGLKEHGRGSQGIVDEGERERRAN